jgi:hypothetical protein
MSERVRAFAGRALGLGLVLVAPALRATDPPQGELVLLDPFAQATHGFATCPEIKPPYVTLERMHIIAHERAERLDFVIPSP